MTYKELLEKLQTLTDEQLAQTAKVAHGSLMVVDVAKPTITGDIWLDTTDDWGNAELI